MSPIVFGYGFGLYSNVINTVLVFFRDSNQIPEQLGCFNSLSFLMGIVLMC